MVHCQEKLHHYSFACEVNLIRDHKLLVVIFQKDMAALSQRLQQILLCIHQDRIRILYKPGLQLYISNWLSRQNHNEGTAENITDKNLNINAIKICTDISECIIVEAIRHETAADDHLNTLTVCVINGWTSTRVEVKNTNI